MTSPMAAAAPADPELVAFHAELDAKGYRPLWLAPPFSPGPRALARPWLWPWAQSRELLLRAQQLTTLGEEGNGRRVIVLSNPSLAPGFSTTRTLSASVQLVGPGEQAPSHRHTMAALRFVMEGGGGLTVVDGEPVPMEPGDLILTPSWTWHGHENAAAEPTVWLDIIDAPLMWTMDWAFFEGFQGPGGFQPATEAPDASHDRYGHPGLLPAEEAEGPAGRDVVSPMLRYPWAEARAALDRLRQAQPPGPDGTVLRYTNPTTGGSVMPTVHTALTLLGPGASTTPQRRSSSTIFHVAEGSGFSVLDGERIEWEQGDTLAVPTWCWWEHHAGAGDAVLFSASDEPVLEALHILRTERAEEA